MQTINRRDFISNTSIALVGLVFATTSFDKNKYKPLLSFSTLGCPDWSLETILNVAVDSDFKGIEIRGLQRQMDLTKSPEFNSKENILATLKLFKNKKIKIVDLGTSAKMHHIDPVKRKENLDEAKSFIDLAKQLSCPYVRVFPDSIPKEQERNETITLIVKGLQELGDYAIGTGVTVLMETHGDLVQSEEILKIMQRSNHPNVGLVWDIVNMWSVTREPVAEVYGRLKKYIFHTHIKDIKFMGDKEYHALIGRGDTPIFEAIDILAKDRYKGYFSFEWEKFWSPLIEEPEIAIPDYAKVMKQHFKDK